MIPNLVVLITLNVKSPYAKSLLIGESNVIEKVASEFYIRITFNFNEIVRGCFSTLIYVSKWFTCVMVTHHDVCLCSVWHVMHK